MNKNAYVAIIMGSASDYPVMKEAEEALKKLEVPFETSVLSAHRTPLETKDYAEKALSRGIRVIIAGAGGAAHLPGVIAAFTEIPVIGVPIPFGPLSGQDALYSIVQMPKGVPVATVAIGNAWNAGILAAQILGAGGAVREGGAVVGDVLARVRNYKEELRQNVLAVRNKF